MSNCRTSEVQGPRSKVNRRLDLGLWTLNVGPCWPWIAVAALAIIPHLGALSNPFAYDDWEIIPQNPYMVHPHAIRQMFGSHVWGFIGGHGGVTNYYRPLQHLLNYAVFHLLGAQPAWFHLFNVLLHAGVSLTVVAVISRLSSSRAAGILAGLLFAVYPVHSEVVAWIACTPDLLGTLFGLLAILVYLKADPASPLRPARRAGLLGLLALALSLAMFSKEIGVMLPAIIVAYEILVRRRTRLSQWKQLWPQLAVMAAATGFYLAARSEALGSILPDRSSSGIAWSTRLWTCLDVFYRYVLLVVWPFDLNLYRYDEIRRSPLAPSVLAGVVCLAAVVALGWWLYRRHAPELLGLVIYLLALLPMFQLPYLSTRRLISERAMYLPSVGFCWLLACLLLVAGEAWAGRGGRKLAADPEKAVASRPETRATAVLVLILLAAFTARSAVRMGDWNDELVLFRQALVRSPDAFNLHAFLGSVLVRHDRPADAVPALLKAVQLRSDYADAYNNLGRAYTLLGQPNLALQNYQRAAALSLEQGRPDLAARTFSNIGIVYRSLDRNAEAIQAYRQGLRFDAECVAARTNLGFVLLLEGRVPDAIAELQTVIRQDPTMEQAHSNLGLAYAMSGRFDEARGALAQAERLNPTNAETQARIGDVCLAGRQMEQARRRFLRALQLQPANARARAGLERVGHR